MYVENHQQGNQSMLDKMQGFIAGGVDGEKELLFGLITAMSHPIDTVQDIAYAVTHPDLVIASLVRKKDELISDWQKGNTYGWSKTLHEIIWSVIGIKGAGVSEKGADLASAAVKSKLELFDNILSPSKQIILSDGTVVRVSERVIRSNEDLLAYIKRTEEARKYAAKPQNSPDPEKWKQKGGSVTIDEDGTWTYTNKKGQSVSYPDGFPDFSPYAHPTVQPVQIQVARPTNRASDYRVANEKAGLNKNSDPPVPSIDKPPIGYTWHHHQDGKTMILVEKDIHREFTHSGGVSAVNGK